MNSLLDIFHRQAAIEFPNAPVLLDDPLFEQKSTFLSRFSRKSIENNEDVESVLRESVLTIFAQPCNTVEQMILCNGFAFFSIEAISVDMVYTRFICFHSVDGSPISPEIAGLQLQPDQRVDFDREMELTFAKARITNIIGEAIHIAQQARNARLHPAAMPAAVPPPQPAFGLAEAVRGVISSTKSISHQTASIVGHLSQARAAYTGMGALADLFYSVPPPILAPPIMVPNALVPAPLVPQLSLEDRLHPSLFRLDPAVTRLRTFLLGPTMLGYTHRLSDVKPDPLLAAAMLRYTPSSKGLSYAASLVSDLGMEPKNLAEVAELFQYLGQFYNCPVFTPALGSTIRYFFDAILTIGRQNQAFHNAAGVKAVLQIADIKLGALSDPTSNAEGPGMSLLSGQPPVFGLEEKLKSALAINQDDPIVGRALVTIALASRPFPPPPPFPPSSLSGNPMLGGGQGGSGAGTDSHPSGGGGKRQRDERTMQNEIDEWFEVLRDLCPGYCPCFSWAKDVGQCAGMAVNSICPVRGKRGQVFVHHWPPSMTYAQREAVVHHLNNFPGK